MTDNDDDDRHLTETEQVQAVKVTDRRLLYLFFAMFVIFGLLAWRIQINQDQIRDNARNQCRQSAINTTKINEKDEALIRLLIKFGSKPPTPAIQQWINDTRAAHLTVPVCRR